MKPDELRYTAKVQGGKMKIGSVKRDRMKDEIASHFEGKEIEMIIWRKKNRRTTAQNRWYWGVCVKILCGYISDWDKSTMVTPELVHNMLKERFLPVVLGVAKRQIVTPHGEVLEVPHTTTSLSTVEFMDYKALIQSWAAELDIDIPDPNEDWEELERVELMRIP